jgi:hypothetical protein
MYYDKFTQVTVIVVRLNKTLILSTYFGKTLKHQI